MMHTLSRYKFFVLGAAVLLAFGVWYGLSQSSAPASLLTADTPADATSQGVVDTLLQLRAVKLDGVIFTEPAFQTLKDFSTQIVPEPVGRPNPFAPLASAVSANASSTKAAQIFSPGTSKTGQVTPKTSGQ